jgi:DNA-binding PadR family transcriptional regulator
MIIALIVISGGMMPEGKLDRALRRMNADQSTPLGTKDKTLAAMVKDGYIVKIKDTTGGEETVDYIVGPRGKVEVGRDSIADFIRIMYGTSEAEDELDKKISRTLDLAEAHNASAPVGDAASGPSQAAGRKRGQARDE